MRDPWGDRVVADPADVRWDWSGRFIVHIVIAVAFIVLLVGAGVVSAEEDGESRFPPSEGYPSFYQQGQVVMSSGWVVDVNIFYPGYTRPSEKADRDSAAPFPVVVFSPPMDTDSIFYQDYMTKLVSYGFVVAGVSWLYEGDRDMDEAWLDHVTVLDYIEDLGTVTTSPFFGIPDVSECGAFGYSRGGRAAFQSCGADPRISTVVAWMPTLDNASDMASSANKLLIGGDEDWTASPDEFLDPLYEDCDPTIVYILRWGDDHLSIEADFHGELTNDFFRYHLLGEDALYDGLYGDDIKQRAEDGEFWLRIKTADGAYDSYVSNDPPTADAGPDVDIVPPATVHFDGSNSTDDKGIATYRWHFVYDGIDHIHQGAKFSHRFELAGQYVVTLWVTDEEGEGDMDTMAVRALDEEPPVAVAGPDVAVDQHELVHFDGSGSTDNGMISSWSWRFTHGGSSVTLSGEQTDYTFHEAGQYVVTLTVMDGYGNSDADVLTVTVRDVTGPVADAGPDLVVDQGTTVRLNGTGSSDNVGVAGWTWTVYYGTNPKVLSSMTADFTFEVPGEYRARLVVVDHAGLSDEVWINVTVRDTEKPQVSISGDLTVREGGTLSLDASSTIDNVDVVSWSWTVGEGADAVTYEGETMEHTFPEAGEFEVTLTARDAAGNEASMSVDITVLAEEDESSQGTFLAVTTLAVLACVASARRRHLS